MGRVTDNPFWFAKYAEQLANIQDKPSGYIEALAGVANKYYNDVIDLEIAPACPEAADLPQPDNIEQLIIDKASAEGAAVLRHIMARCVEFRTMADQFIISAPAECVGARAYMDKVADDAQNTVQRVYALAKLHGLNIGDTIDVVHGAAVTTPQPETLADGIDEAGIETRGGCLIQGTPQDGSGLKPENVIAAFKKLCTAGVFELTPANQNYNLFWSMLFNTGQVRVNGHLKVKNIRQLVYFVTRLETAIGKWDSNCTLTADQWQVAGVWCRDKEGHEFGDNVLAATKTKLVRENKKPKKSNEIDDAIEILFAKSATERFSQQKKV